MPVESVMKEGPYAYAEDEIEVLDAYRRAKSLRHACLEISVRAGERTKLQLIRTMRQDKTPDFYSEDNIQEGA